MIHISHTNVNGPFLRPAIVYSEKKVLWLLAVLFYIASCGSLAKSQELEGSHILHVPMIHYSPKNSSIKHQTWAVIQDLRGVVYVADEDGIKVFNGDQWSLVRTETGTTVRSLAVSNSGVIYYGAQGEFGKLESDANGRMRAVALSSNTGNSVYFSDVWATHAYENKVVFQAREALFLWDGKTIRSWNSENGYHTSFAVDGEFYVREHKIGLLKLEDDSLRLIPQGEYFSDVRIYMIYGQSDGDLLIGTQERGLILHNINGNHSVSSELDSYQTRHGDSRSKIRLYQATRLAENRYVIATLGAGIVIVDNHGSIIKSISSDDGLPDDWINNVYYSQNGGLWLALNNSGIVYLDIWASVARYGSQSGLNGNIHHIYERNHQIFVATGAELLSMNFTPLLSNGYHEESVFSPFSNVSLPWFVAGRTTGLIVASEQTLTYLDHDGSIVQTCDDLPTFTVYSDNKSDRVLAGTKVGLKKVINTGELCSLETIAGINEEIRSVISISPDEFWLGTRHQGAIWVRFNSDEYNPETTSYTPADGLPSSNITVTTVGEEPLFYSEIGPYRFIEDENRFELDRQLWPFDKAGADSLLTLTEDHHGNVWMVFPDSVVKALPQGNGHYAHEVPEALKFKKTSTSTILVEEDDIVWFNDGDELIRYDPSRDNSSEFVYYSIISRVTQNSDGHPIFNGSFRGPNGGIVLEQPESSILEFPFENRDLTFNVAATTFIYPEAVRFQTRLDGKTDKWSRWSSETQYPVNGLSEGFYTFRVRARDASGRISKEAAYSFVILPPWYRAWWAYLIYVSTVTLLVFSVRKYWVMVRAHKLAAEQAEELERERTVSKKLQEANENLLKANKLKDEFLATTSHELRTPLTAILGFTAILKDEIPEDADYREFLDIIEDAGSRLMETLNSLIDLAMEGHADGELHSALPGEEARELSAGQ